MPVVTSAQWLLAAMRLAPLLDMRGRTVVAADIHDDLSLQNAQARGTLAWNASA